SFAETISPFFGRCAFVWFYLTGAMDILNRWAVISAELTAKHVPLPPLVLLIVLLMIVMGSISLLFGYHTRHAAIMLFGMTMAAAVCCRYCRQSRRQKALVFCVVSASRHRSCTIRTHRSALLLTPQNP